MADKAKKYLRREEASQYLKEKWSVSRKPKTLAKLACIGGGPEFHKAGRDVLYTPAALDAYAISIISKPLSSTSDMLAADSVGGRDAR